MALTFYLFRHATAEENTGRNADFDRFLTSKGIQEAMRMGKWLQEKGENPELLVSSNAMRAMQTAEMVAEQIKYDKQNIVSNENIYEASVRIVLAAIQETPNKYKSMMIFGHNPAFGYLLEHFSKSKVSLMEKAGVAKFTFNVDDWQLANADTVTFEWYQEPSYL